MTLKGVLWSDRFLKKTTLTSAWVKLPEGYFAIFVHLGLKCLWRIFQLICLTETGHSCGKSSWSLESSKHERVRTAAFSTLFPFPVKHLLHLCLQIFSSFYLFPRGCTKNRLQSKLYVSLALCTAILEHSFILCSCDIFVLEEISLLTVQSASYGLLKDSFVYFIVIIGSSIKIPLPLLSQKINSFITSLFFIMSLFLSLLSRLWATKQINYFWSIHRHKNVLLSVIKLIEIKVSVIFFNWNKQIFTAWSVTSLYAPKILIFLVTKFTEFYLFLLLHLDSVY